MAQNNYNALHPAVVVLENKGESLAATNYPVNTLKVSAPADGSKGVLLYLNVQLSTGGKEWLLIGEKSLFEEFVPMIKEEILNRQVADEDLRSSLRSAIDEVDSRLSNAVQNEHLTLSEAIERVNSTLGSQLENTKSDLSNNLNRIESSLSDSLRNETTQREQGDNALNDRINSVNNDLAARLAAEMAQREEQLNIEQNNRIAADNDLDRKLQEAKSNLEQTINTEIQNRQQADDSNKDFLSESLGQLRQTVDANYTAAMEAIDKVDRDEDVTNALLDDKLQRLYNEAIASLKEEADKRGEGDTNLETLINQKVSDLLNRLESASGESASADETIKVLIEQYHSQNKQAIKDEETARIEADKEFYDTLLAKLNEVDTKIRTDHAASIQKEKDYLLEQDTQIRNDLQYERDQRIKGDEELDAKITANLQHCDDELAAAMQKLQEMINDTAEDVTIKAEGEIDAAVKQLDSDIRKDMNAADEKLNNDLIAHIDEAGKRFEEIEGNLNAAVDDLNKSIEDNVAAARKDAADALADHIEKSTNQLNADLAKINDDIATLEKNAKQWDEDVERRLNGRIDSEISTRTSQIADLTKSNDEFKDDVEKKLAEYEASCGDGLIAHVAASDEHFAAHDASIEALEKHVASSEGATTTVIHWKPDTIIRDYRSDSEWSESFEKETLKMDHQEDPVVLRSYVNVITQDLYDRIEYLTPKYHVRYWRYSTSDATPLQDSIVLAGSKIPAYIMENPTRDNYGFTGWNLTEEEFNTIVVNSDIDIIATWAQDRFLVRFIWNDGESVVKQLVDKNKPAYAPTVPAIPHFKFIGWDKDFSNITADTDVYAVFEQTEYPVYWHQDDLQYAYAAENWIAKDTLVSDIIAIKNVPAELAREHYYVSATTAYTVDGVELADDAILDQEIHVVAQYEHVKRNITFIDIDPLTGKAVNSYSVLVGESTEYSPYSIDTLDEHPYQEIEDYSFEGYATDTLMDTVVSKDDVFIVPDNDDVVWYRLYRKTTFTVTFIIHDGGAIFDVVKVKEGETAVTLKDVTWEGHEFKGWNKKLTDVREDFMTCGMWDLLSFYVTYYMYNPADSYLCNKYGQPVPAKVEFKWGDKLKAPDGLNTRKGLKFLGWTVEEGIEVKEAFDVYGLWEEEVYTVFFYLDDEMTNLYTSQPVKYAEAADEPADPTKYGFDFMNWRGSYSYITADTYIFAKWKRLNYNIQFTTGYGLNSPIGSIITLPYESDATEYADKCADLIKDTRDGYTFIGWKPDTYNYIEDNTAFVAQWAINSYKVTFVDESGDVYDVQDVEYGSAATAPVVEDRYGWTMSWDGDFSNITADTTVTARWERVNFKVVFIDGYDNTQIGDVQYIPYEYSATAPDVPVHDDKSFTAWDKDFSKIVADTIVTACYDDVYNEVTFKRGYLEGDEDVIETQSIIYGGNATAPENPVRDGYAFDGWDGIYTNVTEKVVVTAKWTKLHKVVFNYNDEVTENAEFIVRDGEKLDAENIPATPTRDGYDFDGWDTEEYNNIITSDLTVTAQWTKLFTVVFNYNDEVTESVSYIVRDGEKLAAEKIPADPAREGYDFDGWDTEDYKNAITSDLTVTAQWTKLFAVTFDYNYEGAPASVEIIVRDGEKLDAEKIPADPARVEYDFKGWDTEAYKDVITNDLTVKAQWAIKTFTVSFTGADINIPEQTVEYGQVAVKPADPVYDAYNFKYWSLADGNEVDVESYVVKANTIFIAVREIKSYVVTFTDGFGNNIKFINVEHGSSVDVANFPDNPVKDGYTFLGWEPKEVTNVTGDVTVVAQWDNVYTVTFTDGFGNDLDAVSVVAGGEAKTSVVPTHDGLDFAGWDEDFSVVNSNLTVNAKWTATVTFTDGFGTTLKEDVVAYGEDAVAPADPSHDGLIFKNWDVDYTAIQAHTTINATWVAFITFDFNDGVTPAETSEVAYNHNVEIPEVPAREGYVFKGWNPEVDEKAVETVTYVAQWTKLVTVTFVDGFGNTVITNTVEEGSTVTAPAGPTHDGYVFKGWNPAVASTATEDVTYTAQWTKLVTVTFVDGFGKTLSTNTVEEGSTVTAPADPTQTGYVFKGWNPAVASTATEDVTYTAQWTKLVTVTFNFNDGVTANQTSTVEEGSAVTAPADPAREGYVFKGWNPAVASTATEDVTYVAQWTKLVTVTFVDGFGKTLSTSTVEEGSAVTAPADPTQTGYVFKGWNPAVAEKATEDVTYTAQWTKLVTVTFVDGFGNTVITNTVEEGSAVTAPTATHEDLTFKGWNPAVASTATEDVTYTAQWTATVVFNFNDGVTANQSTVYNYGDNVTTPADPTREGYVFNGWNPTVSATAVANVTYVAQWSVAAADTRTITFVGRDGSTLSTVSAAVGEAVAEPNTDIADYVFTGWDNPDYVNTEGDVTVKATYKAYVGTEVAAWSYSNYKPYTVEETEAAIGENEKRSSNTTKGRSVSDAALADAYYHEDEEADEYWLAYDNDEILQELYDKFYVPEGAVYASESMHESSEIFDSMVCIVTKRENIIVSYCGNVAGWSGPMDIDWLTYKGDYQYAWIDINAGPKRIAVYAPDKTPSYFPTNPKVAYAYDQDTDTYIGEIDLGVRNKLIAQADA